MTAKKPAVDVVGGRRCRSQGPAPCCCRHFDHSALVPVRSPFAPRERFHAPVGLGAPLNYSAAADSSYYDCARATLGRVVFHFYLPPLAGRRVGRRSS